MASPMDQYSPCPGGTGKKIRFCCKELLPDLQRLKRMAEGEQWSACYEHIDRLQGKYPDRACLYAMKGVTLAHLQRFEELKANAEAFVASHPDNPIAHAEAAWAAAFLHGGRAGIAPFLKALACCQDEAVRTQLYSRLLVIIGSIMAVRGVHAARALLEAWGGDAAAAELNASYSRPLWFIEPRALAECPADFPWKAEFDEALQFAQSLRWFEAERAFTALAERSNDIPAVWRNLMIVRAWVADMTGSAEAARRYASLVESDEDAAELEAYAAYASGEMLGDGVQVTTVRYPVIDLNGLRKALEQDAGIRGLKPADRDIEKSVATHEDWYRFVGPPATPQGVPEWACLLVVTRARGETPPELMLLGSTPESRANAQRRVEVLAGGTVGSGRMVESTFEETATDEESATELYLRQEFLLRLDAPPEWQGALAARLKTFLRERWPTMGLGLLQGKSFREGLADGALRRRALAAILLLEYLLDRFGLEADGETLRGLLGVGPRGPIDPQVVPLASVSLSRLHLVEVEKLAASDLVEGFERAWRFGAEAAVARFAPALAQNGTIPWNPTRVKAAIETLSREENYARVLAWCQRWRQEAREVPGACAKFDMQELRARFFRGELREVRELANHLRSEHYDQPGVVETLQALGAAMEDIMQQVLAASKRAREPSIVAPDGGQAGKLWTPDSARPPGNRPTLWTPGNP